MKSLFDLPTTHQSMPVAFVGHGSPMNALEDNFFTQQWKEMAQKVGTPKAILCISAHWETNGTKVLSAPNPKTIHDFYGFPKPLFDMQYPAPGTPQMAEFTKQLLGAHAEQTDEWGFDHGTWSVLVKMFPDAQIPVYQISLNRLKTFAEHVELAKMLAPLRKKGVFIIGSGNIVHNLGMLQWTAQGPSNTGYQWATDFDSFIKEQLQQHNIKALTNPFLFGQAAKNAIPTPEHYLPMLYAAALKNENENLQFFADKCVGGSISMRSFLIN